jgi:hypothetical protein
MNVVFIVFNRPGPTRRVAEAIRKAGPSRLLVVADGPRSNRPHDPERVEETRRVIDSLAWPCEIHRRYADTNLGCRRNVTSGLDWAFSLVEEAIILEDDLLPDQSFFPYCVELLERYRTNEQVAYVGGYQFFPGLSCVPDSYYFSIYGGIWGWATWRRAWRLHDDAMTAWPDLKRQGWPQLAFPASYVARFFEKTWDAMYAGHNSWGYRWYFTIRRHDMLCVMPRGNLIENIGFGQDATHTTDTPPDYLTRKAGSMAFPLCHPSAVTANSTADATLAAATVPRLPGKASSVLGRLANRHAYGRLMGGIPFFRRFQ